MNILIKMKTKINFLFLQFEIFTTYFYGLIIERERAFLDYSCFSSFFIILCFLFGFLSFCFLKFNLGDSNY